MYSLAFLAAISFFLSLAMTPGVRVLARRLGCLDRPDGVRRTHEKAVPRVGGVGVVLAYGMSYAIWYWTPFRAVETVLLGELPLIAKLLPPTLAILLLGLFDDIRGLRPWQKLAGQVAASGMAFALGVRIDSVAGRPVPESLGLVVTMSWLLLCINAFNLIDGMDGLATGIGLLATLTTLATAVLQGNMPLAIATVALAGSLLGFLYYNVPPASIFLGDSGSMVIGLLLGCYGVVWSQKCATLLSLMAPIMAVAVPILDVSLAIGRRFLSGKPIFQADRGHIHHRLLDRGLTVRKAMLLLYGMAGVGALFALIQSVLALRVGAVATLMFASLVWLGVHWLKYSEFRYARRLLMSGVLQDLVRGEMTIEHFKSRLASAASVVDVWRLTSETMEKFGMIQAEGRLAGVDFKPEPGAVTGSFSMMIELVGGDYVRLQRATGGADSPALTRAVQAVAEVLPEHIERLRETKAIEHQSIGMENLAKAFAASQTEVRVAARTP